MPAPTEQAYTTRLSESEALLREAVDAITVSRPSDCELVAVFLDGEPETMPTCIFCQGEGHWSLRCPNLRETPDRDCVWERLPNGEYAWLRADMTGPRR